MKTDIHKMRLSGAYDDDVLEFIMAVDAAKKAAKLAVLPTSMVFEVVKQLGYVKKDTLLPTAWPKAAEERMLALHDQGMGPTEITAALVDGGFNTTYAAVASKMRRMGMASPLIGARGQERRWINKTGGVRS